jgi:hypothetical protein
VVIDRHAKYRPRIDRLEMSRFAGLFPSIYLLRSVRSVLCPVLMITSRAALSCLITLCEAASERFGAMVNKRNG